MKSHFTDSVKWEGLQKQNKNLTTKPYLKWKNIYLKAVNIKKLYAIGVPYVTLTLMKIDLILLACIFSILLIRLQWLYLHIFRLRTEVQPKTKYFL